VKSVIENRVPRNNQTRTAHSPSPEIPVQSSRPSSTVRHQPSMKSGVAVSANNADRQKTSPPGQKSNEPLQTAPKTVTTIRRNNLSEMIGLFFKQHKTILTLAFVFSATGEPETLTSFGMKSGDSKRKKRYSKLSSDEEWMPPPPEEKRPITKSAGKSAGKKKSRHHASEDEEEKEENIFRDADSELGFLDVIRLKESQPSPPRTSTYISVIYHICLYLVLICD